MNKTHGLGMILMLLVGSLAQAHIASNGFLKLTADGARVAGSLELAIRDGELAVGLDRDGDGKVTWRELKDSQAALQNYVQGHLHLDGGNAPCRMQFEPLEVNERVDGNYLWLPFIADCGTSIEHLSIEYSVLDTEDPSHRGLLTLISKETTQTAVLGGAGAARHFDLNRVSAWSAFAEYLRAGIWHIWSGIDHLLFLISLLLPAVLLRRRNRWEAVPIAAPAFVNIVKVVTAFTLAHSITLSLAAFDIIRLPTRLTESVIAASIIIAALNNVFPRVTEGRWRIAFAFGLLHGFGFASVLAEMGLPQGARLVSLVAFNLGVEAGQLAVVLAVMPIAYLLRSTGFYRRGIMPWGSTAIACVALFWFVQRAVL
jgi:HupE / UreJ protein